MCHLSCVVTRLSPQLMAQLPGTPSLDWFLSQAHITEHINRIAFCQWCLMSGHHWCKTHLHSPYSDLVSFYWNYLCQAVTIWGGVSWGIQYDHYTPSHWSQGLWPLIDSYWDEYINMLLCGWAGGNAKCKIQSLIIRTSTQ